MRTLWPAVFIVLADQITKLWVKATMFPRESIPVLGDWFRITYTENPGMAFGLQFGGGDAGKLFLTVFSVVATIAILIYLVRVHWAPLGYRLALAFILGGAVGNVIDRVFYSVLYDYAPLGFGNVVDFVHLDVWQGTLPSGWPLVGGKYLAVFPIGNIADLAIIAGVVLLLFNQNRFHEAAVARHEAKAGEPPPEKDVRLGAAFGEEAAPRERPTSVDPGGTRPESAAADSSFLKTSGDGGNEDR